MTGRLHPLQKSLVRFFRKDKMPFKPLALGSGVVVSDTQILTCAHVVISALGLPHNTTEKPDQMVSLDFPFSREHETFSAKVIFWDRESDLAVLACPEKIPTDIDSASFSLTSDLWGRQIQVFGFPQKYGEGVWAEGKLRGQNTLGWVEIVDLQGVGHFIQQGFSGGPIWDNKLKAFLGLIVAVDSNSTTRTGYLIPADKILEWWGKLPVKKTQRQSGVSRKGTGDKKKNGSLNIYIQGDVSRSNIIVGNDNNSTNQTLDKPNHAFTTARQTVKSEVNSNSAPRVFLSYHPEDKKKAQQIWEGLKDAGLEVWRSQSATPSGAQFSIEIEQAIRRSPIIIVLITKNSTETTLVRNQISFALEYNKFVIPLLLEEGIKPFLDIIDIPNVNMAENWLTGLEKLIEKTKIFLNDVQKDAVKPVTSLPAIQIKSSSQNPFIFGSAVPAELFTERKAALNAIAGRVGNYYSLQSISIVANRRMGKTSLLNYIWKKPDLVFSPDHVYATIYVDAMDARAHSIPGFMRILRRSIEVKLGKSPWAEKDDGNLTVLSEALEEIAEEGGKRVILLLDEFESVMAHQELDILLYTLRANGSNSKIGMIVATAHELPELEREGSLVSLFSNIFQTYYLGLFSKNESNQLIRQAFERSGKFVTDEAISLINELSGGHPHLLQLAGSIVWRTEQTQSELQNIKLEFTRNAKSIFTGIQQQLNSAQLDAVKQLAGIKTRKKISENVFFDLRARGILDESNALFSNCFADYLREEMR